MNAEKKLQNLVDQQSKVDAEISETESAMGRVEGIDVDAVQSKMTAMAARLPALRIVSSNLDAQIATAQEAVDAERRQAAQRDFDAASKEERSAVATVAESLRQSVEAFGAATVQERRKMDARAIVHPDRTSHPTAPLRSAEANAASALQTVEMWLKNTPK